MEEEFQIAKTATKAAVHLLSGKVLSTVIGAVGTLVLIRLIGAPGYGDLFMAMVLPNILMLVGGFGVGTAITKFLAEYRSTGRVKELKTVLFSAWIFRAIISLGLTISCYLIADVYSMLIGNPEVASTSKLASLYILGITLHDFYGSVCLGLDAADVFAYLMILYRILSGLLPIILVLSGLGLMGALWGLVLAPLTTGFLGLLPILPVVNKLVRKGEDNTRTSILDLKLIKKMVSFGMPIMVADLIRNGLGRFNSAMISAFCLDYEIGNFAAANRLLGTVNYLTLPISSVLFPTFSKITSESKRGVLKKIFRYSVKYSSLLVLPFILLLLVFAHPLTTLIFGFEFESSWLYLTLMGLGTLTYGLGSPHLRRLLLAQGETSFVAKLDGLTAAIGVSIGSVLIPYYGVLGLIITNLVISWPSYILAVKSVYKKLKFTPPFGDARRLYASLGVMALVTVPLTVASIHETLKLIIGSLAGLVVYVLATITTRTLKKTDITAIRKIATAQPVIGTFADKLLNIMEWMIKLRS